MADSGHSSLITRRSLLGFSFTEVLVILVLLGGLGWLVMPRCSCGVDRNAATTSDIKGGLATAIKRYQAETGSYPRSLRDLVTQPSVIANWNGPYLDTIPKDPWGHPYVYVYPGRHNPRSYDLYSLGRDGQEGTADDIGNWTKQ